MQNGNTNSTAPAPQKQAQVHPEMRLYLLKDNRFFGPGPARLLDLIDKTASLRDACKEMGLSYSKGWKMIVNIENQLGISIVQRKRGGAVRGESRLTEEGHALLLRYAGFAARCQHLMEEAYAEAFGSGGNRPTK